VQTSKSKLHERECPRKEIVPTLVVFPLLKNGFDNKQNGPTFVESFKLQNRQRIP